MAFSPVGPQLGGSNIKLFHITFANQADPDTIQFYPGRIVLGIFSVYTNTAAVAPEFQYDSPTGIITVRSLPGTSAGRIVIMTT